MSGIHSTRITTSFPFIVYDGTGLALYDIIFTIIGSILTAFLFCKNVSIYNVLCISLSLYLLGIILHIIFKVKSPVTDFILQKI